MTQQHDALNDRAPADGHGNFHERVAALVDDRCATLQRPVVVGLCGPQGSGKTTATRGLAHRLRGAHEHAVATLSLDDLYLPRAARARLAADVHPLLGTRGVPGTHDVELGLRTIHRLVQAAATDITPIPSFDKASDEPRAPGRWIPFRGRADVVILEGWCVGALPQDASLLAMPVNALEREQDGDARWRTYVNEQLAGRYQALFGLLDVLVMLAPPRFEQVTAWRIEQEHGLAASERDAGRSGPSSRIMNDSEVARFVQFFERLTRHMLVEMPARADLVVSLGARREILALGGRATVGPHADARAQSTGAQIA
ncbi:MAG: hypothetical protein RL684_3159 [Pseudomonadota bacterium]|jgi:D-glycerate 3-kinase